MKRETLEEKALRIQNELVRLGSGNICPLDDPRFDRFDVAAHRLVSGIGLVQAGTQGKNPDLVSTGKGYLKKSFRTLKLFGLE